MIPLDDIFLIQPKSADEVKALQEDIKYLASMNPGYESGYEEAIADYPEYLTLIYHHDTPIAYIELTDYRGYEYLGKETLEFGGAVHPDYRKEMITQRIVPMVLRKALKVSGKKKILTRVDDSNKEAQKAVAALGFKRIGRSHDKRILYKLDRNKALAQV